MHYLYICTTCKKREDDDVVDPAAGEKFYESVKEAFNDWPLKDQFELIPSECLSGCKKSCTFALQSPNKYSYIFGFTDPSLTHDVLSLAQSYEKEPQGILKKTQRPDALKDKVLARIPPMRS